MIETWRRFWRLSGFERGIVCEATAALPVAWASVRVFGFQIGKAGVRSGLEAKHSEVNAPGSLELAKRIVRLEAATAARLPLRPTCLEQSLVLCWMLRRRGMKPELRIGARKEAERFEAHAWVELDGAVLDCGGSEHLHFVPFEKIDISMETQTH